MRRIFVPNFVYLPNTNIKTMVRRWIKTSNAPLMVEYLDGFTCKSDYRSITELKAFERVIEL